MQACMYPDPPPALTFEGSASVAKAYMTSMASEMTSIRSQADLDRGPSVLLKQSSTWAPLAPLPAIRAPASAKREEC